MPSMTSGLIQKNIIDERKADEVIEVDSGTILSFLFSVYATGRTVFGHLCELFLIILTNL